MTVFLWISSSQSSAHAMAHSLSKKFSELQSMTNFTLWWIFLLLQLLLMLLSWPMLFLFFHVSSEDADSIRIHTLSETSDIESLEKMVDDSELGHGPSPLSWRALMVKHNWAPWWIAGAALSFESSKKSSRILSWKFCKSY